MMAASGIVPRVLFLFTEVCANGGIQRFNQTILDSCGRLGIQCRVLSLNDSPASIAKNLPLGNLSIVGFSGDRRRFVIAVAGALLRGRYDRVFIGHINFLLLAIGTLALRPFNRAPTMLVAHGIEVWTGIGRARRYALSRVTGILCVSNYTRRRILEQAPALIADRLIRFPNALADTWGRIVPAPPTRSLPARFILSVTRLDRGDRYKGIATVIEAFSMLADDSMEYFVVGRGNDLSFLQLVAERCGVKDRVHFMSGVSDSELIALYEKCEVFVLPSGKEGFGIVFLEAMFFGAPVIAASERGALDVIEDGDTGLLVRFGDCIALKRAIERLTSDPPLRDRLRKRARETVIGDGEFTFSRFTARTAEEFALASRAV